jgi:hypothetical protein
MAAGDRTESRLLGPENLGSTTAALGSAAVPSNRQWVVKQIALCNTDGADRIVYLGIGGTGSGQRLLSALPIAAGDTLIWDTALVLNAGERFHGFADTGSVVTVTAIGWLKETA